jgi:hypothetical protein
VSYAHEQKEGEGEVHWLLRYEEEVYTPPTMGIGVRYRQLVTQTVALPLES